MTIKLWLDDVRDPTDPFIQQNYGAEPEMIWVKTVDAAISRLKDDNVYSISFDHDLGTKETGYDLAKWIEERAFNKQIAPLFWTVHSNNPEGARNINQAMLSANKYWTEQLYKEIE